MPYTTDGLVGKLALQKGMISGAQLKECLAEQAALKQGVASSDEINQALRLQAEAAERGEMPVPRLGQILIQMGVTEEKEIQRTLKLQYKTLYECPGCTL